MNNFTTEQIADIIDKLPVLTDIVEPTVLGAPVPDAAISQTKTILPPAHFDPPPINLTEIETALSQQIEGLLKQKLLVQFEAIQLQAITQAVNEIKAELPELIRQAVARQN